MNYKKIFLEFVLLIIMGLLTYKTFNVKTEEILNLDYEEKEHMVNKNKVYGTIKKVNKEDKEYIVLLKSCDNLKEYIFNIENDDKLEVNEKVMIIYDDEELIDKNYIKLNNVVSIELIDN